MFCSKCGKEIDDNAEFCQFCGQKIEKAEIKNENKKTPMGCIIGVIILTLILMIMVILPKEEENENTPTKNKPTCPPPAELEEAINLYKEGKIITKIDPELNTVYISQLAQNQLEYDDMQTLGYLCACYSSHIKGTGLVWADIKSSKDHKTIAKYSQSYGFKMN